jgi:hypothetical protein
LVLGGRSGQGNRKIETQRSQARLGEGAEDGGWGRAVGHRLGASRQSSPTPTDGARHCITRERVSGSRGERCEKWPWRGGVTRGMDRSGWDLPTEAPDIAPVTQVRHAAQ